MTKSPKVIACAEHGIKRSSISSGALRVIDRLQEAGFQAYVVGGGVRDLLLGMDPKDFDVATDATPEEVEELFRSARLIGRRFRLAHVRMGKEIVEVATFRGSAADDNGDRREEKGRILRDNVFGSEQEDAVRRDFTINALMYDPHDETIRDYVGGYEDVMNRRLRLIGDPVTRYREDPVRLLRAVRFLIKLDLKLEPQTAGPIPEMAQLLVDIPSARLFEEILKLFLSGRAWPTYRRLVDFDLWEILFPGVMPDPADPPALVRQALINTDERTAQDLPVTPGFLFAALLWPAVERLAAARVQNGMPEIDALADAGEQVLRDQVRRVAIPRRFSGVTKQIWTFQPRFKHTRGKRVRRLLAERRFRAAYDFLLLRAAEDPALKEQADWWTKVQEEHPVKTDSRPPRRKRRPRRHQPQAQSS